MPLWWWILAGALVFSFAPLLHYGQRFVASRFGREAPAGIAVKYEAVYFAIAIAIAALPIYAWPDHGPLFYSAWIFAGAIVGSLVAQAVFGRRAD